MGRGRRCQAIRIASPGMSVDSEAKRQIVVILSPSTRGSRGIDNHEFRHRLLESLEFLGLAIENGISNRQNKICIHRVNMQRVLDMTDRELWNRTLKSIQISSMQSKGFVRRYC
jgi:poly-D-alanine transfer protein DltD